MPKRGTGVPSGAERRRSPRGGRRRLLVLRKCRVCDWREEVLEPEGDPDPGCPWCFAPTYRAGAGQRVDSMALAPTAGKNPHAAALGRLGGLKGGPARAAALSPLRRREIALNAARARWARRVRKG
jgi:hypothetical protein